MPWHEGHMRCKTIGRMIKLFKNEDEALWQVMEDDVTAPVVTSPNVCGLVVEPNRDSKCSEHA